MPPDPPPGPLPPSNVVPISEQPLIENDSEEDRASKKFKNDHEPMKPYMESGETSSPNDLEEENRVNPSAASEPRSKERSYKDILRFEDPKAIYFSDFQKEVGGDKNNTMMVEDSMEGMQTRIEGDNCIPKLFFRSNW